MSDDRSRSTVYFEGLCRFDYSCFSLLKTNLYSMNTDNTIVSASDYILVYRHTYTHAKVDSLLGANVSLYFSLSII